MNRVYFWGTQNEVGYLSNWYPANFNFSGRPVANSEQAFMMCKATVCGDEEGLERLSKTTNPAEAKKIGRSLNGFDTAQWDEWKVAAMYDVNFYKYTQNPKLLQLLLDTGDAELIEASPKDWIWGSGLSKEEHLTREDAGDTKYPGLNLLGKVLSQLRDDLKGGYITPDVEYLK
jgi:ribA/ribD-fused uncharacterized protein